MRRGQGLARLFRALSSSSLKEFARQSGIHPGLLQKYESGGVEPSAEHLSRMAAAAGLSVKAGEELLGLAEVRRRARVRPGAGNRLAEQLAHLASSFQDRLLTLPAPAPPPRPEDRELAREQWERLKDLPGDQAYDVMTVAPELQTWALTERVCEESVVAASRDVERALFLGQLAVETARRVRGPAGFPERLQGFAYGHRANALRVKGELSQADDFFGEARRLWAAGSDPAGLLDPGRLLDLEASLRRGQRRFGEALSLLQEALAIGRSPGRYLLNKGFTLEVMGSYGEALATLKEAEPLVEEQGDPRLLYVLRFNLAVNHSHLGRFSEARTLVPQVREIVNELGDHVFRSRITWLEGRIAAGLGRRDEALALLSQAREEFARREMWYDVALALLEEAVLLLEAGRAAECKELARDLAAIFEARGVHPEALAALRLFREAADHEVATADLARRVLTFLFRARHDEGLRYGS